MTEETVITHEETETETEPLTPEQQTEADLEAAAQAERGFNKARGKEVTEDTDIVTETDAEKEVARKAEADAEAAKKTATDAEAAKQVQLAKFLDELPDWQRKVNGVLGDHKEKLEKVITTAKTATTAAGGAAPTDQQIQAALSNPEEMKQLLEEYPDFAPVGKELTAIREQVSRLKQEPVDMGKIMGDVTQTIQTSTQEVRELIKLDAKHPDWETTINSKEFNAYALEGGPDINTYLALKPEERDAKANEWSRQYPKWWGDRGAMLFSDKAADGLKLLDGFAGLQEQKQKELKKQELRQKQEKRLQSATTPKGMGVGGSPTGLTDEQLGQRGFNKARGVA